MRGRGRAPRVAGFLVRLCLPEGVKGRTILGDLSEEYHEKRRRRGTAAAWRAYWLAALSIGLRYGWDRLATASLRSRRGASPRAPFSSVVMDVRYGWRQLVARPGFTMLAVLTLALGVGANAAVFSVIHSLMLDPFPYAHGERLVLVGSGQGVGDDLDTWLPLSHPDFLDLRGQVTSFDELAPSMGLSSVLHVGEARDTVYTARVSAEMFAMLGVAPALGRALDPRDDRPGADPVAVLSHGFWQDRFGSDPALIGTDLVVDGRHHTVVGIMPPRFQLWEAKLWTPIGLHADDPAMRNRGVRTMAAVGRLREGVGLEQARADLTRVARELEATHRGTNEGIGVRVLGLRDSVLGELRAQLLLLFGAAGFILLIACGNVANLLLSRGADRHREIAVRQALGARRGRLVRQLLTESALLAVLGAAGAAAIVLVGLEPLVALIPPGSIPSEAAVHVSWGALAFNLAVALLASLLFGLAPAFGVTRAALERALYDASGRGSTGRRGLRAGRALVVAQVALSAVLLVGAGLLIRSFGERRHVSLGFIASDVLVVGVSLPASEYPTVDRASLFVDGVLERLAGDPALRSVAVTTMAPFAGSVPPSFPLRIEGEPRRPGESSQVLYTLASKGLFETLGAKLVEGRAFTAADRRGSAPVAIVNEAAVKGLFAGQGPLGRRVRVDPPAGELAQWGDGARAEWMEVIGVVSDMRQALEQPAAPQVYVPFAQSYAIAVPEGSGLQPPWGYLLLVARTTSATAPGVAAPQRRVLARVDGDNAAVSVTTMEQAIARSLVGPRFVATLLGLFSALALALTVAGVFGVVAQAVTRQRRELAVRIAVGAGTRDVLRLVLVRGVTPVCIGLSLGLAGAAALSRLLSSQLFGVSPTDPSTFATVALVVTATALLACYLPARRAARVDPVAALRAD